MTELVAGLRAVNENEHAITVNLVKISMMQRVDHPKINILHSSHPIRTQLHRSISRARKKYDENVAKQRLYAGVG